MPIKAVLVAGALLALAGPCRATCVEVEVNGLRSLSYDCLSRQLQAAPAPSAAAATASGEWLLRQPSNRLGLFNHSATQQRMGSAFGHAAQAQRPLGGGVSTPLPLPERH